jgi:hypothetical protein
MIKLRGVIGQSQGCSRFQDPATGVDIFAEPQKRKRRSLLGLEMHAKGVGNECRVI